MKIRTISREEVEEARRPWVWDLGNRMLYDFCRTHPTHREDAEIVGKIWLIGRSYSAAIERRRNAKEPGDSFYEKVVAPAIRRSKIDTWLDSVRADAPPGDPRTVEVHKFLTDLFCSITGLEKRSLASKYLHFHKPDTFFIYDSRAREAIARVVPRLNHIPKMEAGTFDPEYKGFVRRCLWLHQHLQETHEVTLTPRELDKLLLLIIEKDSQSSYSPTE